MVIYIVNFYKQLKENPQKQQIQKQNPFIKSKSILKVKQPKYQKNEQQQQKTEQIIDEECEKCNSEIGLDYSLSEQNNQTTPLIRYSESKSLSSTQSPKKNPMLQRFKNQHRLSIPDNLQFGNDLQLKKSKTLFINPELEAPGSALQKKKVQLIIENSSSSAELEKTSQHNKKSKFFQEHVLVESEQKFYQCPFFEEYEQLSKSGEGAHGVVYKVCNKTSKEVFAAKLYRTMDEELIINIRNELEVLQKIAHPNILQVYELLEYPKEGIYILLMEYIDFTSLKTYCENRETIDYNEARNILKQIVAGVGNLHTNGVSHRDLHCDNILISEGPNSKVKIIDFNVSKLGGSLFGKTQDLFFTPTGVPKYRSPECKQGSYSEKNDIWMLGLIAYRLFTNQDISTNRAIKMIKNQILFSDEGQSSASQSSKQAQNIFYVHCSHLQDLIYSMLLIDPCQRKSASELIEHQFFIMDLPCNDCEEKLINDDQKELQVKVDKQLNFNIECSQ